MYPLLPVRDKQITFVAFGLDIVVTGADCIELSADAPHNNLQGFLSLVDRGFPYRIVNLLRRIDLVRMSGKEIQNIKFVRRKIYGMCFINGAAGGRTDGEGAVSKRFGRLGGSSGADARLHPQLQLF